MTLEIRKYKFSLSIFDIVSAVIGMILLFLVIWKLYFTQLNIWNFIIAAIILSIPVGIVFHVIFGINSTLNYKLGLSNKPK
jgi:hypothetical protein